MRNQGLQGKCHKNSCENLGLQYENINMHFIIERCEMFASQFFNSERITKRVTMTFLVLIRYETIIPFFNNSIFFVWNEINEMIFIRLGRFLFF